MKDKRTPPILFTPEYIIVNRNANQAINTGVWTTVQFDTTFISNGIVYDSVNNQVVIPSNGLYTVEFCPRFASSSTGAVHGARILKNTVIHRVLLFSQAFNSNSDGTVPLTSTYYYFAGDILSFQCLQGSGVSKNLSVVNDLRTYATIIRNSND